MSPALARSPPTASRCTNFSISALWREPYSTHPDLWFAMAVARHVNFVPTLQELGWPVPWEADRFLAVMEDRKRRGEKVESTAYKIRPDNRRDAAGQSKFLYVARNVLTPLWQNRESLRPRPGDCLGAVHARLLQQEGLGSFMAAQIVADLKYVEPLSAACDWWTFAASGPGSRAGLNRVLARPADATWTEPRWRQELETLAVEIAPRLEKAGVGRLHNQDLQNVLCEFARYEKLRLGEGIARRYP
jgi:5-hmdU DNA kinase-like protein